MSNDFHKVSYIGQGAAHEFFDRLTLEPEERSHLQSRGLTDEQILKMDYRTVDPKLRVFDTAWDEIRNSGLSYVVQGNAAPQHKGLLLPVYDERGAITSFIVRRRGDNGDHKYIFWKTKQGKVRAKLHIPVGVPREDVGTIVLTEGILKSDVYHVTSGKPVAGMHGLFLPTGAMKAFEKMGVVEIDIALDQEEKGQTREARFRLKEDLERAGFKVGLLKWDGGYKGIDDAVLGGAEIRRWTNDEIEAEKDRLARNIVYVQEADSFFYPNRPEPIPFSRGQISTYHGLTPKQMNDMIIGGDVQRVQRVIYDPSRVRGVYGDLYNTYQPPHQITWTPESYRRIARAAIRHLKYLVPDRKERKIVLQWAASIVQNPGQRHRWMLMLFSESQQIGKGLAVNFFRRAIGADNWATLSNDSIVDPKATFEFFSKLVAQVEEIYHQDNYRVVNNLKERITEPFLRFERKYMNAFTAPNTVNWIGLTNQLDALKIDGKDQRFCFIQCAEERATDEHYKEIGEATELPEAGSVLRDLLSRVSLAGYSAQTVAPSTDTKELFVDATRSKWEGWLVDQINLGKWPGDCDVLRIEWIQHENSPAPDELKRASSKAIAKWVKAAGFKDIRISTDLWSPPVLPGEAWVKSKKRVTLRVWVKDDGRMTKDEILDRLFERGPEQGTWSTSEKPRDEVF